MRRLFALLLVGCASTPPPPPPVQQAPAPPKEPTYAAAVVVDPKTIVGYVKGVGAPEPNYEGPRDEGEITALESKPQTDYINKLRFDVKGIGYYLVLVPRALPLPFSVGDRIWIQARDQGGGPNHRVTMTMKAADGSLLFAVDEAPQGWKVEAGKRVESKNEGDYIAHKHEVIFETEGNKLTVKGDWARFDVGAKSYYVWGVSVDRERLAKGQLPLDYVGGWLDFAIVRAR